MQRADTLYILKKLVELMGLLVENSMESRVKYLLVYIGFLLGEAWLYDYTLRHASRHYFIRADLLFPKDSPYYKALDAGNDMAYIQLCRMPKQVFDYLMTKCDPEWVAWHDGFTDRSRVERRSGRPHMLKARDIIALTLCWLGSQTSMHQLELVFGVGHSVLQRDLKIGLAQLREALHKAEESACKWPTPLEMEEYARAIEEVWGRCPYPSVRVWGWLDGLRLVMKNADDPSVQNHWYNGWVGACNATNVLLGLPTGKFAYASINHPGRMHDFTVARNIFEKLAGPETPIFHVVAGDSAFASSATNSTVATKDSFIPPLADTIGKTAAELATLKEKWAKWIGSVRQSTEHGMRTLQAVWGRLKTELPTDEEERGLIIEICVLLHNFKCVTLPAEESFLSDFFFLHHFPPPLSFVFQCALFAVAQPEPDHVP